MMMQILGVLLFVKKRSESQWLGRIAYAKKKMGAIFNFGRYYIGRNSTKW
jgi:hypothetical protein